MDEDTDELAQVPEKPAATVAGLPLGARLFAYALIGVAGAVTLIFAAILVGLLIRAAAFVWSW